VCACVRVCKDIQLHAKSQSTQILNWEHYGVKALPWKQHRHAKQIWGVFVATSCCVSRLHAPPPLPQRKLILMSVSSHSRRFIIAVVHGCIIGFRRTTVSSPLAVRSRYYDRSVSNANVNLKHTTIYIREPWHKRYTARSLLSQAW
jgi:hypothetical protein